MRALFEQRLLPLARGVDAAFVALLVRGHELPSGSAARFARFPTDTDIVSWICQLVGSRDGEHAFAVAARRRLPTRLRSGTACRRARRRCRFTASGRRTKRRPRKCSSTAATSSIRRAAMLDYHPVEIARQMALAACAKFVLVRPSELISRAWMKDAADAHARDCPNIKRIINQFNRISRCGVGNNARHRRRADAPQLAQALHRAGALLPRRAEPARECTPSTSASTSGPCSGSRASGRSCRPSGRSATPELDQLCNPKSNSGRDARARSGRGWRLTMRACST